MSSQPYITDADIEHRFGYHRATFPIGYDPKTEGPLRHMIGVPDASGNDASAPLHAMVRHVFIETALRILQLTPPGREQSLALTSLQEASMWTNAAVAMQSPLVTE